MKQPLTLEENQIAVSFPHLPDETLRLQRMVGREEVGRAFEYELELVSDNHAIAHEDVLGRNLTVSLFVPDHEERFFNGHVTDFAYTGAYNADWDEGGVRMRARYRATVRPWLWFLTLRTDCRVFQNLTVPDILEQTFRRHGFSDFSFNLTSTYDPWENCVQYRETDFDFVSRLMEHEGIYYYFDHDDGRHTMVLCDGDGIHDHRPPRPGYEELPYHVFHPQMEHVFEWTIGRRVESQGVGLKAFNFRTPRDSLSAAVIAHSELVPEGVPSEADLEVYDYPGKYETPEAGDAYARKRMEELETRYETAEGRTNARGLAVGSTFKLVGHPRTTENREYMVVSATYELTARIYESASSLDGAAAAEVTPVFVCSFRALDARRHYHPPRTTPRPVIQGPQTAIVVGPSGEKVWPDKYGRVKVQFHWDRYGQKDDRSSCWIRVSQSWAGAGWGGMHIPHIGQEVIVEFLDGDPDRPLITGRVYNAGAMPPLALPDHKDKSILSDNYGNRLIFDATPGDEHVVLSSPHHQSSLVLGRSIVNRSESELVEFVGGTKTEVGLAAKAETLIGSSSEAFLGLSNQFKAAASMEAHLGPSVAWRWGPSYQIGDSDEIRAAEKGWLQLVTGDAILDCKAEDDSELLLCAGEKREALVEMSNTGLRLAAGEAKPRQDEIDTDPLELTLKRYMAVAFAVHAALSTVAAVDVSTRPGDAGPDAVNDWVSAGAHIVLLALTVAALRKGQQLYNQQQKPANIKKEIQAQKANAEITLEKTGDVSVKGTSASIDTSSTDGDILIKSGKGTVTVSATDRVRVDTKILECRKGLRTKNIIDMG